MSNEELNIILNRGENIRTEFKEARDHVPGGFYQTVVSFLNREGGVIVLGADDDGLAEIEDADTFLFQKGGSWGEEGVKSDNFRMHIVNVLQFEDFQKGSSWEEKGGKLLPSGAEIHTDRERKDVFGWV
ncbi:MAG: ATP-binding protein [Bacteroidetes bacterium]|nr:ATP-binding protein [Bacteroidota bacterium]